MNYLIKPKNKAFSAKFLAKKGKHLFIEFFESPIPRFASAGGQAGLRPG